VIVTIWLPAQQSLGLLFLCAPVCISKYCDENNGTGTNNWIPVQKSHSYSRRKNKQQLNLITLSNRFPVLDNLYELSHNTNTNIVKVHKDFRAQIE